MNATVWDLAETRTDDLQDRYMLRYIIRRLLDAPSSAEIVHDRRHCASVQTKSCERAIGSNVQGRAQDRLRQLCGSDVRVGDTLWEERSGKARASYEHAVGQVTKIEQRLSVQQSASQEGSPSLASPRTRCCRYESTVSKNKGSAASRHVHTMEARAGGGLQYRHNPARSMVDGGADP